MTNIINFDNFKNKQKVICEDGLGRKPYESWIESLPEEYQVKVEVYLRRVLSGGSKKNIESVGDGISELKIDYGPGIRVYFGENRNKVVLLIGGDKKTQNADIQKAKQLWRNYEKT